MVKHSAYGDTSIALHIDCIESLVMHVSKLLVRLGQYEQNNCPATDKNCVPCAERLPSCVGLPDGNNIFPSRAHTRWYIRCYQNRTLEVTRCPPNTIFDITTYTCTSSIVGNEWEEFCKVNPRAIQPHRVNCAQFYNCTAAVSGEGSLLQECRYPDLFSQSSLRCDDFQSVPCGARHEPQTPCEYKQNLCQPSDKKCQPCPIRLPSCLGLSDGQNPHPSHLWGEDYIVCFENRTLEVLKCRVGYFNPRTRRCSDFVDPVDMVSYCQAYPTVTVAQPWNCAQFFNCSHRQSKFGGFLNECPYPMLYSTDKHDCLNFTLVNCKSRPEPQSPCEYRQNLCSSKGMDCVPCSTRLPSCVGQPDGFNSFAGALWTVKYILCFRNRTIEVNSCKSGVFNPVKRECDSRLRPGERYCQSNPGSVVPHPANCAQYYNCSQRNTRLGGYLMECPYPQLFSTISHSCQDFTTTQCHSRFEPKSPCEYINNRESSIAVPKSSIPCPERLPSCLGLSDGRHEFLGRRWMSDYIICYHNRTVEMTKCSEGYFDPYQRICVKWIPQHNIVEFCGNHPQAFMPHLNNCAQYFICKQLQSSKSQLLEIQECPYPQLFSSQTMKCQAFHTVQCIGRKEPMSPCEYKQNACRLNYSDCIPCLERLPSCVGVPDGPHAYPNRIWTYWYILCDRNRTIEIRKCQHEQVFDPKFKQCVSPYFPGIW
ncbi:uncharacterized protein LOC134276046 [Saccostrea cucullata]|uniref:uncharacterized protein LOC134276046 n=1 Tax=Saccostrea cuccullata TaxID=36930 RepID=UPI002ED37B40